MPRAPEPDPPGAPELPPGLIGRASPRAGLAYRLLRLAWRLAARLLGWRVAVAGRERLPAGGAIVAGLPHRAWVDPFLLWGWLPAEPRLVFFGDARTMARSPLRRWVLARVGGILPIPSRGGPHAVAIHLEAATRVLEAGARFCLFPESGSPAPVGTTRPVAPGIGYIALRSGAPIVPVVIGGNDLLYLGRRFLVRIGEPVDWRVLAALDGMPLPAGPPPPGTPDERDLAHRVADGLRVHVAAEVRRAHEASAPPPGARLRGTRLTRLFR